MQSLATIVMPGVCPCVRTEIASDRTLSFSLIATTASPVPTVVLTP